MWIVEISLGTTFGKPSNGGAETGGAVISMTAVGIGAGEDVGTGLKIDTFAAQARDANTRVTISNLIRMGLLVTVSTKDPMQKFLAKPLDNCRFALPHSDAERCQSKFDVAA
jgi:hypothetical protein